MPGPELTSPRSPRVLTARRLAKRSFRAVDRRFLAEGPQAVREALAYARRVPGSVAEVFLTAEAAARHPDLAPAAAACGAAVHRASGEVVSALSQTVTPQGVVAVCSFLSRDLADVLEDRPRLVVVLASVRDPGNAGTVLRVADAAGAEAVILTDASVDVYNGKCVRATAGSIFHVPIVTGVRPGVATGALRAAGMLVLAADGSGDDELYSLLDAGRLGVPTAWLFGNEAWGLPPDLRDVADAVVRVPIHGSAESLNLATAAAVCLYASAQAQRSPGGCRSG